MQRSACSHGNGDTAETHSYRKQLTVSFIHTWNILAVQRAPSSHPRAFSWQICFFVFKHSVAALEDSFHLWQGLCLFSFHNTTCLLVSMCVCVCVFPYALRNWQPPLSYLWLTCRRDNRDRCLSGSWGAFRLPHFWQPASFHRGIQTPADSPDRPKLPATRYPVFHVSAS